MQDHARVNEATELDKSMNDGKEIIEKLEDFFDHPMTNPLNYPNSFKYYVMIYQYHKKNEIREGHK